MDAEDSNPALVSGTAATEADISAVAEASVAPAVREDQIQNAVAFLSHPKVRGSPVSTKRTFLEKKGLTSSEIDEAFKRVPEAPAAAAPAPAVTATTVTATTSATPTYGANNLVTYTQQPLVAGHAGQAATPQPQMAGALVPLQQQQPLAPQQQQQQPLRWTQVVLGLGVAAASLYGLHQLLAPRITHWAHQWTAARREAQEAEAARAAALTAALESLAQGQQQQLEVMQGVAAALEHLKHQPQQHHSPLLAASSQQAQQLYGPSATEASSISFQRGGQAEYLRCQSPGVAMMPARQQYSTTSGPNSVDSTAHDAAARAAAVRGWDPYSDPARAAALRSAGYAGSNSSKGISSNYTQQQDSAAGAVAAPADGFEVVPRGTMQPAGMAGYTAGSTGGSPTGVVSGAGMQQGASRPDEAPHSAAFHEVMEMVRAGITPPNVRTDINDNPPDPSRPITAPQLAPRGKPWERSINSSKAPISPAAAVADNFMQQQQLREQYQGNDDLFSSTAGFGPTPAGPAAAAAGSLSDSLESSAAEIRHKSMEKTVRYDLSALLGQGGGTATTGPWRPPPPPEPTLLGRPNSSGSSSSKTGGAATVAPALSAAGQPSTEEVVASVAAKAVQNVMAAAEGDDQNGDVAAPASQS